MDCSEMILETPEIAYRMLLKSALAIPMSHYLVGLLSVLSVFVYNFLEFHLFQDLFTGFRGQPVRLTYNARSEFYHGVVSKCKTLHGRYLATPWLSNPHFQTIFINLFGRPPAFIYRRQMYHASDGGMFALDWLLYSDAMSGVAVLNDDALAKDVTTPIVIVIPGLGSDSSSPYMKHLVFNMAKQGWNVVVCNHRGLGGVSLTTDRIFDAGWTEDTREVVNYLHREYSAAPLFVVGTSIGANILVKYLGENKENVPIVGAAAVCCPWDLTISSRFLSRRLIQRLYDRALTSGLRGYAQMHKTHFSRLANWEGIETSRTTREYDTHATCLIEKCETADAYYRRSSSSSFIGQVSVPLLCISALDDPVCTMEAIPWDECRVNKNVVLATTLHGGHLACFEGLTGSHLWWVKAVNEYIGALLTVHAQKKAQGVGTAAETRNIRIESNINQISDDNRDPRRTNKINLVRKNHASFRTLFKNKLIDSEPEKLKISRGSKIFQDKLLPASSYFL